MQKSQVIKNPPFVVFFELYLFFGVDIIESEEYMKVRDYIMRNVFILKENAEICIANTISDKILYELWNGFCGHLRVMKSVAGEDNKISIGNASFIPLDNGDEYTVCVRGDGVGILGNSKKGLLRGFIMLMLCIEQLSYDEFGIECGDIHGNFKVKNRMVHLCVFPETTFETLKRQVRLCGVLQYTHLIIEFWGMLKYDCLKELSWPCGFEKDRIREIISEARGMGMEPVPMFNHLGHASQCRIINGKHTVLDQNMGLMHLFTPDGWAWNIRSGETGKLLQSIRKELYDVFGEGEYVHLGCDEAYIFGNGYIEKSELRDYLGKITYEAVSEGRKPIVWADMLVGNKEADCVGERYYCAKVETEEAELIRASLAPETIIADWQYNINEGAVKTSVVLKKKGYNVVICPWHDRGNIDACVNTAVKQELFGVMETAWHTLSDRMQSLLICARRCGLPECSWSRFADIRTETATILRKVSGKGRAYEECGFTAHQVGERNSN